MYKHVARASNSPFHRGALLAHSFAYFVIINYFCVIYGNVQPWWIDCSNVALNLFVRDTGAQAHKRNVRHIFFRASKRSQVLVYELEYINMYVGAYACVSMMG